MYDICQLDEESALTESKERSLNLGGNTDKIFALSYNSLGRFLFYKKEEFRWKSKVHNS